MTARQRQIVFWLVALWFSGTLFCRWPVKHCSYDALAFMYAWAYNVQPNQVLKLKSPKPHNCEWGAAKAISSATIRKQSTPRTT